jgi:hypothetical protein
MYRGLGQYATVGETVYVGASEVIRIPDGFVTDLASVPRVFWSILPPDGTYERAAVVHDWHCTELAAGNCAVSSHDADGMFRRMCREGGTSFVTRWILWTGVRIGALFNRHRRAGWLRDAPAVLAITALMLAVSLAIVVGADAVLHPLLNVL